MVQGDQEGYHEVIKGSCRVRMFYTTERGLSKSRNMALRLCESSYAYITDDDVDFNIDRIQELVACMENNGADVGTAQFSYKSGGFPKEYSAVPFQHNFFTAAKVSSIEICMKVRSIKDAGIHFDEMFGLGTDLPSGEEYIFLTDCLKSGLRVSYFPILVGVHPDITSGQDFYSLPSKTLAKREMLNRVFSWRSPVYILAFWIKKLPEAAKAGYGWEFTRRMVLGMK